MGALRLRDTTIEVIKNLPKDCTMEDIMYGINLTAQVYDGLKDVEVRDIISTESLLNKIDEW